MRNKQYSIVIILVLMFGISSFAQQAGGAAMYSNKNIIENVANSKDHTTFVTAVKAIGLVETLQGDGPFTVFAPTNAAFDKLPKGTIETLLKPENKKKLQTILAYHVVAGRMSSADIEEAIKTGNGKTVIKTINEGTIIAWMNGKDIFLSDENGNKAKITIEDVNQSSGVIHVVDAVLLPKK
ncbi:fasciclin domain-containing protein [Flavobacterium sp.]|uniref:fasciclin domain-containing protein n=1 Tax=Flavobacterium sp. TaxID=239 RepID=UPI0031D2BEF2